LYIGKKINVIDIIDIKGLRFRFHFVEKFTRSKLIW